MTQPPGVPRPQRASRPAAPEPAGPTVIPSEVASVIDALSAPAPTPASSPTNGHLPDSTIDWENVHDFNQGGPGTFTTIKGVVLKLKPYPAELVVRMNRNAVDRMPQPPREFSEADKKWTSYPDDPDYLKARALFLAEQGDRAFMARVRFGTELLSIPEDGSVIDLEDDTWIEMISDKELFGEDTVEPHTTGFMRYVDWLQFYVFSEGDVAGLYREMDRASGIVKEGKVVEAINSFRHQG